MCEKNLNVASEKIIGIISGSDKMPAIRLNIKEVFLGENFVNSEPAFNSLKLINKNSDKYLTKLFITN